MATRRLNHVRYRSRLNGAITESYEEWRLYRSPGIPSARLFSARDAISGIKAPNGFLWCKALEVHPPDGDHWEPF